MKEKEDEKELKELDELKEPVLRDGDPEPDPDPEPEDEKTTTDVYNILTDIKNQLSSIIKGL